MGLFEFRSNTKKPGTVAGAEPAIISAWLPICKAKCAVFDVFGPFRVGLVLYDAALMRVLGIETSCDETGVALFDTEKGLVAEALHSQVDLHAAYGGVVPEIASRDHIRCLLPLVGKVLENAKTDRPDAVAYTAGPGLVGALMVGSGLANGLALAWRCPLVPVHHMEGHLLAPMLESERPEYPYLALLVSGGHTMLVSVQNLGEYRILGSTLDDAVGEAFDKTAKILGLGYPGGPILARLAEDGDAESYAFPRPMIHKPGMDFSFSGLKTAVMLVVRKAAEEGRLDEVKANIAASFQRAAVDTLIARTLKAAKAERAKRIVIAGGVGANKLLRRDLASKFDGRVYYPRPELCTDNGAMIAVAGALRLAGAGEAGAIQAVARWSLDTLQPPLAV
jgi:N6-L-threonylcarbamoyladenine synthase